MADWCRWSSALGQERYRVRQGLYRIIYEIGDAVVTVTVVKVGHRRHV
ncbi:MAG: type II toxin-antitoxin system RelE family toxin [Haliea sp.]